MTITRKIDIEIFVCVGALILVGGFTMWKNKNAQRAQLAMPIVASNALSSILTVPTPVPQTTTISQPSPDGKKKLVMKTTREKKNILSYEFTTTDGSGENIQPVFSTTVEASMSASEGLGIPFNTWSPDDKYVFIQKNDGDALVFKATGEQIIPDHLYLDARDIFDSGKRTDMYHVTTGWASPTLLIINTVKEDGTKGSSYWFEVPSKAIIQLSSQF